MNNTVSACLGNEVRDHFPVFAALKDGGEDVVICDGAGGSQVPATVPDAMARYLLRSNANVGGEYGTSERTLALVTDARAAMSAFLGCSPQEVVFGANATNLTFHVSRALSSRVGPGDNIIVSRLDHDCNVGPWTRLAAERGATRR